MEHATHDRRPLLVLIIDHTPETRDRYVEMLRAVPGVIVRAVDTPYQAMRFCTEVVPDTVVAEVDPLETADSKFYEKYRALGGPMTRIVIIAPSGDHAIGADRTTVLNQPVDSGEFLRSVGVESDARRERRRWRRTH